MLAVKNLARNPLRTGLTVLGVALGIAMLVSVSGYGNSIGGQLQNAVGNRYQLILQANGVSSPLSSSIALSDVRRFARLAGIEQARPIVIGSIRTGPIPYFLLLGIASGDALSGNISLVRGSWVDPGKAQIMLGHNAANSLQADVGDEIRLRQQGFRVAAIFSSESNILNHAGIVELADAQHLLARPDSVNLVLLRTAPGHSIKPILRQAAREFPHLQVTRSVDLLGRLELFIVIEKITASLSLIAIVFCVLIVTNTLLMSLFERKREIGILLAIGWNRWLIARGLLFESLLISFSGSILGIGIGAWVLHYYSQSNIAGVNWGAPVVSTGIVAVALVVAVVIALLGSIYPLLLSSRWSPAEVLQRELT